MQQWLEVSKFDNLEVEHIKGVTCLKTKPY
jgi:hypothetical protein